MRLLLLILILNITHSIWAQVGRDSAVQVTLQTIEDWSSQAGKKYVLCVNKKIERYNTAVSEKMIKSLTRLAKWESKIKTILDKSSPATSQKLFGNNQVTFSSLLIKLKQTQALTSTYTGQFNHYTDKLNSQIQYLETQRHQLKNVVSDGLARADSALNMLNKTNNDAQYLNEFIKERRQALISEALNHIGKSRLFKKINQESYYYSEALKNYQSTFSDPQKVEQLAATLLSKIPAFKQFAAQHSQLAGVFAPLGAFGGGSGSIPVVNGLASRADVQNALAASGADASALLGQLHAQPPVSPVNLDQLKDKLPLGGKQKEKEIPGFTPNSQRNKTFRQRLEVGSDFQFGRAHQLLPTTVTTGLTLGYKINDKSSAGIGMNYLLGLGNGWQNIRLTSEGIGFRSYVKWKFKGNFYLQAGGEWNYMMRFAGVEELKKARNWQQATLIGLSKQYMISKKVKGNVQLLFNLLHYQNQPRTQPLVIRLGYGL